MNLRYENKLWRDGYSLIAGLDEVGRGSWAGPLVAGMVILAPKTKISGLKDSKLLSPNQRQQLFLKIIKKALAWSVGVVSHNLIDELGILEANKQAFLKAIDKINVDPDYLIIDGVKFFKPPLEHQFIIDGDNKISSVAAASIIAKVVRDRLLESFHFKYPQYNFYQNKGYGTPQHSQALEVFGLSEIHRLSYKPIQTVLESEI